MAKTVGKINFNVLQEEVIRQFDEHSKLLKSHAHLAEVLIGFVLLFFIYFLKDAVFDFNFSIAVSLIFISGILGAYAFWIRDFPIGMNIRDSLESVLKNRTIDLRAERFRKLLKANEMNAQTIKKKSLLLKLGYVFYFIGLIEFFLVKFIYSYFF